MQPLHAAAQSASAVARDHQDGAQMSQELPSLHDWNQASHAPSTAAPATFPAAPATSHEAAALSHQAGLLSPPSSGPHMSAPPPSTLLPSQLPLKLPSSEALPEEAERQLEWGTDRQKPNAMAAPQSLDASGDGGVAEPSNSAAAESQQQGMQTFTT